MTKFYRVVMLQGKRVDGDGRRLHLMYATKGIAVEKNEEGEEFEVNAFFSVPDPKDYIPQDYPNIVSVEEVGIDEIVSVYPNDPDVKRLVNRLKKEEK